LLSFGVIIIYAIDMVMVAFHNEGVQLFNCYLFFFIQKDDIFSNLTSNQVGLPAELKHINKRRKRN
jgi:hypothetical protein